MTHGTTIGDVNEPIGLPGLNRDTHVGPALACRQIASVSGRYDSTKLTLGGRVLELRVDVDQRTPTSPVTNAISGDFFETTTIDAGGLKIPGRSYRESWRALDVTTVWSGCTATIKGLAI